MAKSILISIKPRYVADILNNKKTIEVRKSMPKCDLPIDVYIYCTKDNKQRLYPVSLLDKSNQVFKRAYREDKIDNRTNYLNGKVVAKFTLNKVEELEFTENHKIKDKSFLDNSCLTNDELWKYLKDNLFVWRCMDDKLVFKGGTAWYINNLEIFDKPKELSEFKKNNATSNCWKCKLFGSGCSTCQLTKAPQNYMFIEEELL